MHHLHIFLSSPGDVSRERQLAQEVIERIQSERAYRDRLKLEVVAWDKPGAGTAMPAQMEPQEAIDRRLKKPSQCDIVVVIFWARMGTPLSENYHKPDGSRYRSGTEYEYLEALGADRKSAKPDVLVYRRKKPPDVNLDDPEHDEKKKQWDLVKEFFAEFRNPDGTFRGFFQEYDEPSDFEKLLGDDLRDVITTYLDSHPADETEVVATAQESLWDESPFPGLRAFTPEEAIIFHGRSPEIDSLTARLSDSKYRFIAVVGASGSGKSSLVAAGLLPALENNAIHGGRDWVWARFTPGEVGNNPFMALAVAFKPKIENRGRQPRDMAIEFEKDASVFKKFLAMVLENKPHWAELLLFIDQFEELFTLVDKKYQRPFVDLLAQVAKMPRVRTVLTMRADFYPRCLEWPVLDALLSEGQYPLLVPRTGALHEMIIRPAERAKVQFEDGLPQRILDDTGTEPGALALMAYALSELWEASKGSDRVLTHAAYDSFNGVPGAIGKRAEDTFKETLKALKLKEAELQTPLGRVFQELIEVDERGVVTRRRASLSRLTDGAMAEALVNALTEARLLVKSRGENNQPVVEVAHEAIFANWDRLSRWIEEHAGELRVCRRLKSAAQDWQEAKEPRFKHLPDRSTLKQYRKVQPVCSFGEEAEVVRRFLSAGRTRQRVFVVFLTLGVVLLSILGMEIWRSRDMNLNVLRIWALAKLGRYDGPKMVEISGGPFQMGSSGCADVDPELKKYEGCDQHPVTVRTFWIGKYEVTFDEYLAFVFDKGTTYKPPPDEGWGRGSRPVINVSWDEARAYAAWLSDVTHKEFRLPTEAEWEYAARANSTKSYWWGNDVNEGGKVWANCSNCGSEWDDKMTAPVGSFPENPFRIHDMNGNVWEWVEDDWHDSYEGAPDDGSPWVDNQRGPFRVIRGGSWGNDAHDCRSAFRGFDTPDYR
ncbi:MAG: SUMF1/EgtB/PvdO family nonheme iron enzyme, partial [Anaerolineales bacterium]